MMIAKITRVELAFDNCLRARIKLFEFERLSRSQHTEYNSMHTISMNSTGGY